MTLTDTQVGDQWGELERLAKAAQDAEATPTAWFTAGQMVALADIQPEDAAFIAAATPATVLELIAAARSVGTKSEGRSAPQEDGLSITHSEPDHPIRGEGEPVAWRWRNKPDGVWNYQEARQRIPNVEQQPLYAHPPTTYEANPCQRCGGEIQGWTCQDCGQVFSENEAGNLVFATHNGEDREALRNAVNSAVIRWVYSGEQDLGPRVMTGCNFSLLTDQIFQALQSAGEK